MKDINQTLLQKASGENRFNPDEQRRYMNTFRERVILVVDFSEATTPDFNRDFSTLCQSLSKDYQPLFLKLSLKLADGLQMTWMKTAKASGIIASIIDEATNASPYALVFHTDTAIYRENIHLKESSQLAVPEQGEQDQRKSFWQTLFGK